MVLAIDDRVPDPDKERDDVKRGAIERALAYMRTLSAKNLHTG